MAIQLTGLRALEILDSRGRPTVQVEAELSRTGSNTTQAEVVARATAQVPSGASTGTHEAHELRDGKTEWFAGKGVTQAVANVTGELLAGLRGMPAENLAAIDQKMIALDGTPNKSRLGANAILGVSCAVARAFSIAQGKPLYRTLAEQYGTQVKLPLPMINILSGGLHAGGNLEFQDFLIYPHGFATMAAALEATVRIHAATERLLRQRGFLLTGVADEGGWGPRLASNEEALALLTEAISAAGFAPGGQVSIALDVASTHFFQQQRYHLHSEGRSVSSQEMVDLLAGWATRYPVVSIEDGLAEDDWSGWQLLQARLGAKLQLVGDDLFTTNEARLRRGINEKSANAVLVKMNQIGSLYETFNVCRVAAEAGFTAVISARSGETEDGFLADLATATGAGQIKIGSITRSERLAKYNRLLELEAWEGLAFQPKLPANGMASGS